MTTRSSPLAAGRPSRSMYDRSLQISPPERYTDLVRQRGGLMSVPRHVAPATKESGSLTQKMTRLLLNVNMERSLGPVHVVMLSENTVKDLVKAAIGIYVKEKRRPLLKEIVPDRFELHYSRFSLESLKPDEKLINLRSRNFFLCWKPSKSANPSCLEKAEMANNSRFPLRKLMDLFL